ncbi:DMT family transporter [Clostridium thermarum]|uniref:DMT family transporter n=1 Tax=Clostridium thermarum TaxID=1716543 RepID=UPI0013D32132|nr:DMT family transporter [Clostridium thermarum]
MNIKEVRSNILLLITATIWGFAFVAQRVGLNYVEAFTFNAVRFALGALSLLPLMIYQKKVNEGQNKKSTAAVKTLLLGGLVAGSALFLGASLQQVGLAYTTAGKAAFITGLYIALVPILGIFLKQRVHFTTWIGVSFAVVGLYFLSVNEGFSINKGDLLQFIGAFFWAVHILVIDYLTKKVNALTLSFLQFITCSILSFIVAVSFENISVFGLSQAPVPILYGGICSVGIAYTLQVFGQKYAKPSHAAIIMSMEAVFASIGGMLLLNERLDLRGFLGCSLMFTGMLLSQVGGFTKSEEDRKAAA